jgi:hypothetical protein
MPSSIGDAGAAALRSKAGFVPREMEDKWFVFSEEPWLFVHRSCTGIGQGIHGEDS